MGMSRNEKEPKEKTKFAHPFHHQYVWVQCNGFRCLAYRENDGNWRTAYGNKKLTDVVRVIPFNEAATN